MREHSVTLQFYVVTHSGSLYQVFLTREGRLVVIPLCKNGGERPSRRIYFGEELCLGEFLGLYTLINGVGHGVLETSGIVAVFEHEIDARRCLTAKNRVLRDPRWALDTTSVTEAAFRTSTAIRHFSRRAYVSPTPPTASVI